jgi:hypothetical protein
MKNLIQVAAVLPIAALSTSQSLAQAGAPLSADDLSKESENPVTRLITLPLRYEADFQDGATKATKDTFEIDQAVVPLRLNDDWSLITRTKLPAEVQPPKDVGDHWVDGLSNGYTTFFLSPEHGRGFYWGGRAGALLPDCHGFSARRQQMGLRPVGGIRFQGYEPVCIQHGCQQHLVLRWATWQQ